MSEYRNDDTASWNTEEVRQREPERRRRPVKRKRKKRGVVWLILRPILYIFFVLLASALLAGSGWLLMSDLCAFNKEPLTATIHITSDDDVSSVAEKLKEAGLIEYPWFFNLFGKFAHAEDNIGMGSYTLTTDMDYRALIVGMRSASGGNMNVETVLVTMSHALSQENA